MRRKRIPKAGQQGKYRDLGIPTVYDRVRQQVLLNRLEPIFKEDFLAGLDGTTQLAMSNEWLARQGLISFKDLWVSFAYPR